MSENIHTGPSTLTELAELQITYSGEALDEKEIEVDIFASSLLSLSKLIKKSVFLAFNEKITAQLKFKDVTRGSLSIQMILTILGFGGAGLFFLTKYDLETQKKQLLKNLGFIKSETHSLISFFKTLRGRKIVGSETDSENVRVTCDDKTIIYVRIDLYRLIENQAIQKHQYDTLEPLAHEGISKITYSSKEGDSWIPSGEIQKKELSHFEPKILDKPPVIEEFSVVGQLDRLSLLGDPNSWKLITREKVYTFKVSDEAFLSKVKNNEIPFVGSDFFKVRMISTLLPYENHRTHYEAAKIEPMTNHQKSLF